MTARDLLDESLSMLQLAIDGGTTDIMARTHSSLQFHFQPQLVAERVAENAGTGR